MGEDSHLHKGFIFVDLETDGLNGPMEELHSILLIDGVEEELCDLTLSNISNDEISKAFDAIAEKSKEHQAVVVFWHGFMSEYLAKHYVQELEKLHGHIIFLNIIAYMDGYSRMRYSIIKTTDKLLGREHKGNAKDDARDLMDCFDLVNSPGFVYPS